MKINLENLTITITGQDASADLVEEIRDYLGDAYGIPADLSGITAKQLQDEITEFCEYEDVRVKVQQSGKTLPFCLKRYGE